jgi:hypothetical protein
MVHTSEMGVIPVDNRGMPEISKTNWESEAGVQLTNGAA